MPTRPDPDSPYVASQLQATFGVRAPGTPSMAGKPGVQAADVSFPAPPGVAGAPPGRPPAAAAPVVSTPSTPTPQAGPAQPGAPKAGDQTAAPAPLPPPTPGALPLDGSPVATSLGTATLGDDGAARLALSPEGDMRYREAVLRGRAELGPLPRIMRDAALPELPYELGKWNYNPFTGAFNKG